MSPLSPSPANPDAVFRDLQGTLKEAAEAPVKKRRTEVQALAREVVDMAEGNKKLSENCAKSQKKGMPYLFSEKHGSVMSFPLGTKEEFARTQQEIHLLSQEIQADEQKIKDWQGVISRAESQSVLPPDQLAATLAEPKRLLQELATNLEVKKGNLVDLQKPKKIGGNAGERWESPEKRSLFFAERQFEIGHDPMGFAIDAALSPERAAYLYPYDEDRSRPEITRDELLAASKDEKHRRHTEQQKQYADALKDQQLREISDLQAELEATQKRFTREVDSWIGILNRDKKADTTGFLKKFEKGQEAIESRSGKTFWFDRNGERHRKNQAEIADFQRGLKELQQQAFAPTEDDFNGLFQRIYSGREVEIPFSPSEIRAGKSGTEKKSIFFSLNVRPSNFPDYSEVNSPVAEESWNNLRNTAMKIQSQLESKKRELRELVHEKLQIPS